MPVREIYRDASRLAKIYPPVTRTLIYGRSKINSKAVRIRFPETIFIACRSNEEFYVAVRPETDRRFFVPLLPNSAGGGEFCLGARVRPGVTADDYFENCVDRFLTSRFEHKLPDELTWREQFHVGYKLRSLTYNPRLYFDGEVVKNGKWGEAPPIGY